MKYFRWIAIVMACVGLMVVSGDVFAKKRKKTRKKRKKPTYSYPYGMAGCGLGSLVIKSNDTMQTFAATLNGTSGNQTFGITTGTSNCELTKGDIAQIEQEFFMDANFASLSKDAAKGEGQYLEAFAEMLGCSDRFDQFAKLSQNHYGQIFLGKDPKKALSNYKAILASRGEFRGSCTRAYL